jgi:hypothetical protein
MKILLREYCGELYTWKTAKYNNGSFYVNGDQIRQDDIVSIINDNRKKYVQCSSCGQIFRKGDPKFEEHKANAIKPETCFGCSHLCVDHRYTIERKYKAHSDGGFSEICESEVDLKCDRTGLWSYHSITSDRAIEGCMKRQCANATEVAISDFFTQHPSVFDDIITIDSLLDAGYDVNIGYGSGTSYEIEIEDEYTLCAVINNLGIVDKFFLWYDGDKHSVYYSKRYDELFTNDRKSAYIIWNPLDMPTEMRSEIKNHIVKLYR